MADFNQSRFNLGPFNVSDGEEGEGAPGEILEIAFTGKYSVNHTIQEKGISAKYNVYNICHIFTSSTTWQVPPGVTRVLVEAVGGGGGGGGGGASDAYNPPDRSSARWAYSGRGGGKGQVVNNTLQVTPGQTLTITVGAGGGGGAGGADQWGYEMRPGSPGSGGTATTIKVLGSTILSASAGAGGAGGEGGLASLYITSGFDGYNGAAGTTRPGSPFAMNGSDGFDGYGVSQIWRAGDGRSAASTITPRQTTPKEIPRRLTPGDMEETEEQGHQDMSRSASSNPSGPL